MNFFINNKSFSVRNKYLDEFSVQSYFCDYFVYTIEPNSWKECFSKQFTQEDCVIIDIKIFDIHSIFFRNLNKNNIILIEAVERNKTFESVLNVLNKFDSLDLNKSSTVFVFGGGIIQDIASLACNIYKRGIKWSFFPTTLLSMGDSCIGSKSSINHAGKKNQLGFYFPPSSIFIDVSFLKTLRSDEILSGNGELLKLSLIGGEGALEVYNGAIENGSIRNLADYNSLVNNVLQIKKSVIEIDEFDRDYRLALNYGHTFGHIIESLANYSIPHGQAVCYGMLLANSLNNVQNNSIKKPLDELIQKFNITKEPIYFSDFEILLRADKKVFNGILKYVTLDQLGTTTISEIELSVGFFEQIKEHITSLGFSIKH